MLDQSLWEASFDNISSIISSVSLGAAVQMHPGSTFNENFRYPDVCGSTSAPVEDKEHVRIESVIALRLINIIMLLIRAAVPWLLLVPSLAGVSPISILEFPDYELLRGKTTTRRV